MLALTAASLISFGASYTVSSAFIPHRFREAAAVNGERLTVQPPPPDTEYQHSAAIGGNHKFHHHKPHVVDTLPGENDKVELYVHPDVPTKNIRSASEKTTSP